MGRRHNRGADGAHTAAFTSRDGIVFEFGSGHTFYVHGQQMAPGSLRTGQQVTVAGVNGTWKVLSKRMESKRLILSMERLNIDLGIKVRWTRGVSVDEVQMHDARTGRFYYDHFNATGEVYGIEAICRDARTNCPTEYFVTHRGRSMWVRAVDCLLVG